MNGAETVDEPIGLRAVVVREDREVPAEDDGVVVVRVAVGVGRSMRVTFMVSVPPVSCQSSSLPPPSGSAALGARLGLERVRELDAVDRPCP